MSRMKGASLAEVVTRHLHAAGRTVAGENGGRAANAVTSAVGLGRIDICDHPACPDCAPTDRA
ncbi:MULTISPECIES: hypothetical protein [Streptomyces]|uniref:Uncharacterized protein n=1 Tax=Streptomyces rutgersensis TaxID=53451 RepID=A0ABX6RRC7_9ACTN|nr:MULTISPECIES: hypothetical protein [Streptomyces]QNE82740.1 hypothetical protein F0345_17805 [Streptomyces rutgersensis]WPR52699.1 hypothetical protein SJI45_18270 [Streptomyces sp. S399]